MPWAPLTPLFQVLWLLPLPAGEGQDHLAPAAWHQEELGLPHALGLQGALTAAGLQWSKSGPVVQLWWSLSGPAVVVLPPVRPECRDRDSDRDRDH